MMPHHPRESLSSGASFAAALIAGGRSRRMEGRDKALLDRDGEPMWQRQLRVLGSLNPGSLLLSAREDQFWTAEVSRQVILVPDPPGVDQGPLGGIVRCLEVAQAPLVALGIDLPRVTTDLIRQNLLSRLGERRGVFFKGVMGYEPLVGLYHPSMLEPMRDALDAGQLSLQRVIAECIAQGFAVEVPVTAEIEAALGNANTPGEWDILSS